MQWAFGISIPQTLEDVCDPTRLALIVYDMQVGIVNQIENGQQITEFFRFSTLLAKLKFASSLPVTCHSPRNSWGYLRCVWRFHGTTSNGGNVCTIQLTTRRVVQVEDTALLVADSSAS